MLGFDSDNDGCELSKGIGSRVIGTLGFDGIHVVGSSGFGGIKTRSESLKSSTCDQENRGSGISGVSPANSSLKSSYQLFNALWSRSSPNSAILFFFLSLEVLSEDLNNECI